MNWYLQCIFFFLDSLFEYAQVKSFFCRLRQVHCYSFMFMRAGPREQYWTQQFSCYDWPLWACGTLYKNDLLCLISTPNRMFWICFSWWWLGEDVILILSSSRSLIHSRFKNLSSKITLQVSRVQQGRSQFYFGELFVGCINILQYFFFFMFSYNISFFYVTEPFTCVGFLSKNDWFSGGNWKVAF